MAKLWAGPAGIIDMTTGTVVDPKDVRGDVPENGPFEAVVRKRIDPYDAANAQAALYKGLLSKKFLEWRRYHNENPHVYTEFVKVARQAKKMGYDKWGITGVTEVIRWEKRIVVNGDHAFKIANDHATYYSRLIMMQEPDLYGFFDTKKADADKEMGWEAFVDNHE